MEMLLLLLLLGTHTYTHAANKWRRVRTAWMDEGEGRRRWQ